MRRAFVLGLFCASALLAGRAEAQRGQREPLLSERAFGMGGAVLASSAGPTAAYYNPAGLADTPGTSAGASLSLRTFRSYIVEDGYTSVVGVEDLSDSGLLSVPVFLGAVLKFGDRDSADVREHALAAGMLVRNFLDRELLNDNVELTLGDIATLEVIDDFENRWFYASYAWRPDPSLSFGLTAAMANADREYIESWTQGTGIGTDESSLEARGARINTTAMSLVFRLGASWRPSDWIQMSLVFQVPGIELWDSGSATFERVTGSNAPTERPFFFEELEDLDVQSTVPWQISLGGYARFDERVGVGFDVNVTGTEGNVNDPVTPLGQEIPFDGDRPAATYFADRYWADVSFDVAVGTEIAITREIPLRVGGFLEFSGLPSAFGDRDTYSPDQLNRVGATAGFGVRGDRYDFGLGVGYTHGWGTGLRPVDAFAGGYTATDVRSHEISFYLSGVTGAASQLALDTYRAVTGRTIGSEEVEDEALDEHVDDVPELRTEEERVEEIQSHYEWHMELPRWIQEAAEEGSDVDAALGERLDEVEEDDVAEQLLDEMEDAPEQPAPEEPPPVRP